MARHDDAVCGVPFICWKAKSLGLPFQAGIKTILTISPTPQSRVSGANTAAHGEATTTGTQHAGGRWLKVIRFVPHRATTSCSWLNLSKRWLLRISPTRTSPRPFFSVAVFVASIQVSSSLEQRSLKPHWTGRTSIHPANRLDVLTLSRFNPTAPCQNRQKKAYWNS